MCSLARLIRRRALTATNTLPLQAYANLPSPASLPYSPRPLSDPVALSSSARAAASADDLRVVSALHAVAVLYGFHAHVVVATAILDAYSKCGDLYSSRKMFDAMPHKNVISWNAMIAGYTNAGMSVPALELFRHLRCAELQLGADEYTVASSLTACAGIGNLWTGSQIHGYVMRAGFGMDHAVISALANMYFRCGDVDSAETAMKGRESLCLSTTIMMINGYVANGRYSDALEFVVHFVLDYLTELIILDCSILVSILTVSAHLRLLRLGKQVHGQIIRLGSCGYYSSLSNGNDTVLWSALIDMYCKCSSIMDAQSIFDSIQEKHVACWNTLITGYIHHGLLEEARGMFDNMPNKNVISWTTMISGYTQQGSPQEGLRLLASMYSEGGLVQGNCFTFAIALDACSCLAALAAGKQIHAQVVRTGIHFGHNSLVVETALVDMYAKSGNLKYAQSVFERMRKKNVVSWTSMINGYAVHGSGLDAINVFEQMINMGLEPNEVTFVVVLTACSRCGLANKAAHYFKLMTERYNIMPTEDHYTCIIDLLSRAGKLMEAWKLLEELYVRKKNCKKIGAFDNGEHASMWGALLAGCSMHGEVEIASKVVSKMLVSKQQISDSYIALSNVYAASDMWDEVYKVREEWRKQGVCREPGLSHIQFGAIT
ncbi:Pentatricopeptide repeat-containing protein [Canna indica]|uniref:Pentatricopeptide repeat-containing protein n=1 Tax=Canna indica TaxID=4628 RepID=A0AAQ3JUM8_9LILI|nr:Pentatricopeptide repeat-containing protein [Canna indica]